MSATWVRWRWVAPALALLVLADAFMGLLAYHSRTWNFSRTEVLSGWAAVGYVSGAIFPVVCAFAAAGIGMTLLALRWLERPAESPAEPSGRLDPYTEPHEPGTSPCVPLEHCYGHDLDERGPSWITCGECWHRYRSPRELRKAWRRGYEEASEPVAWWRRKWALLAVRAKEVSFCPHCLHDF